MSDNRVVEWQSKDGQNHRAYIVQQYQFTNANYVVGRMLDTPNASYLLAVNRNEEQFFFTMTEPELHCVLAGLTATMLSITMDRLDQENNPRGLPA